mmetsp:Transcript_30791/g.86295  ORF Transcript_30791/g.86295 Transcript_30791/m.86295 type:complete len:200 (-) Transcript_30791:151-750(-)
MRRGREGAPLMPEERVELSACVEIQADIQACMRPASLLPMCRTPHLYEEFWTVTRNQESSARGTGVVSPLTPEIVVEDIIDSARLASAAKEDLILYTTDVTLSPASAFVKVRCFTPHRWLDILEIHVESSMASEERCQVHARGYSTGALPVNIPTAPLWNLLFCFIPFYDNQVIRNQWMALIREHMSFAVRIDDGRRPL